MARSPCTNHWFRSGTVLRKRKATSAYLTFVGLDKNKGYYKTTRRGKYLIGQPKWGKLKGKTVTWTPGKEGPIEFDQLPSFLLSQIKGSQPVQVQNFLSWMAGEMEGFDAIANSLGLGVRTGRTKKER